MPSSRIRTPSSRTLVPWRRIRTGAAVGALVVGLVGLAGLSGCGRSADRTAQAAGEVAGEATGPEAAALAAMGFDVAQLAVGPSASAAPGRAGRPGRQHRAFKVLLHRNVLHGEVVVQTKDGPQTVVVQRGAVTAIDQTKITVRSSDGFELTWALGDPLHVVEHRRAVQPSDVTVGTEVGVAGPKGTARLIVLR